MRLFFSAFVLSSLFAGAQSPKEVNNLEAFAKLYGYIKYFHPSDEAASVDWNKLAVYGSNAVLAAKSEKDLVVALNQIFKPVASSVLIGKSPQFSRALITPANLSGYKPVFWFHSGVGLGGPDNGVYSSVRMNRPRPVTKTDAPQFAPFTQSIDAAPFQGKEIKLVGRMKADIVESGSGGHFWLRVDREKDQMGFFYNMADRPVLKNEWDSYEFSGKVDKDAKDIVFGGFLSGIGKIWADDIKLFERESADADWKPVAINNGDFESSSSDQPDGWFAGPVSGYKYAVSTSNNNKTLEISSNSSGNHTDSGPMITSVDYKFSPQPGEVIRIDLTKDIHAIIPLALYGTKDHTYPVGNTDGLAQLKSTIDHFYKENNSAGSLAVRLGNVIIAWNLFKHFFPYWEDASTQPDALLRAALVKSFTDKTPADFRRTLLQMTAPLNDGHIWVTLAGDASGSYTVPLLFDRVENKIVIDKILDSAITGIKQGDIVVSINNQPATDLYKEKMSLISGSPQWKSYRAISDFASGAENTPVNMTLLRNGKEIEVELTRKTTGYQLHNALENLKRPSAEVEEGIYYLDISRISKDTIHAWADKLSRAKGIICDLRGYPTGNHNLINHLLKTGEDTKWMFVPQTAYPDQEKTTFKEFGWNMQPEKPYFPGKIVFITDGRAISYAESYMGFIKDFKLATIIGQPTAGTNGNINPFSLPGGYSVSWTGMLVKNHDGSKHHIKGIVPDISLERTLNGITEGRDEFYEAALKMVKSSQ